MAKRFFYVCAGLFLLALTYHMGATSAQGQSGSPIAGFAGAGADNSKHWVVLMQNGDTYYTSGTVGPWYVGQNVFGAIPTPAQQSTFGQVKDRYRR
jgi:hypothetical protein